MIDHIVISQCCIVRTLQFSEDFVSEKGFKAYNSSLLLDNFRSPDPIDLFESEVIHSGLNHLNDF